MNGGGRLFKEDLSTFNIEMAQISKRIAPKSGLRQPAPHLPPPSPSLPSTRQQRLPSGWQPEAQPPACPGSRGNSSLLQARLGAESWEAAPAWSPW